MVDVSVSSSHTSLSMTLMSRTPVTDPSRSSSTSEEAHLESMGLKEEGKGIMFVRQDDGDTFYIETIRKL